MNILVTGAWIDAKSNIEVIEKLNNNVIYMQNEADILPCSYEWVEGIIGNGVFLTHPITKFTNLKYVQLTSAGYDRVDMNYINSHNIIIKNARGVYSKPIAEYVMCGILELYKNSKFFIKNQINHVWEKDRNLREINGETVCIIGCGSVGIECAKKLSGFDCDVYGIDLTCKKNKWFKKIESIENIKKILSKSDIVIITVPLSEKTYHMFNKDIFNIMKEDSILVNVSRGMIVNTEDLIDALEKKLYGAVLDVFEEEPLENSELWDMKNVIITPHNSFAGNNNSKRLNELIISNLEN